MIPCPVYLLRWGLVNFFAQAGSSGALPPSSWDYGYESQRIIQPKMSTVHG
jgi:hypothetical protein